MKQPNLEKLRRLLPAPARERRTALISEMSRLEEIGSTCFSCSGLCCTFVANSMQTTPVETLDLYLFLWEENRWNQNTIDRLRETVRRNRLDQPVPGDGRRQFSRRTYTCPFYNEGPKGCSISRAAKPYGCLAFNPRRPGVVEGGDCESNQELLAGLEQDLRDQAGEADQIIAKSLGFELEKQPMPLALLRLHEALSKTDD